jgi:hypothetical protein
LYAFNEGSGSIVNDTSGAGDPINLTIANTANVAWGIGSLSVNASTIIESAGTPQRMLSTLQGTNQITIEAWVDPANMNLEGPARMVTFSVDGSFRNFTLGQGLWADQPNDVFDMRFRTTNRDRNGLPSLTSPTGQTANLTHIVYTYDGSTARMYINGTEVASTFIGGDFSNWYTNARFGLANEFGSDRGWLGTFYKVAIYQRALSGQDVSFLYSSGAG